MLERVWHYQAHIRVPKFARGYVTPEMTAWDEQSVYETASHRGKLDHRAQREAGVAAILLGDGGTYTDGAAWRRAFAAHGAAATWSCKVRVVRQVAERLIVSEVRKAFEAEAATLRDMATLV